MHKFFSHSISMKTLLICLSITLMVGISYSFIEPVSTAHAQQNSAIAQQQSELSEPPADDSQIYKIYLPSTMTGQASFEDNLLNDPRVIPANELTDTEVADIQFVEVEDLADIEDLVGNAELVGNVGAAGWSYSGLRSGEPACFSYTYRSGYRHLFCLKTLK